MPAVRAAVRQGAGVLGADDGRGVYGIHGAHPYRYGTHWYFCGYRAVSFVSWPVRRDCLPYARRKREFGIRSALGGTPWQVQRTVLKQGMALTIAGVRR